MSAQNRIQALPLHLANQIAAGEVIERPASVVKELVENSIDAGATDIHIDIEGAGSHLIRVRDNGSGIHQDDLALALSRHATSKLHSSEQLSHISSLGFRGEALPSIASVSKLSLGSRQSDSDCGWQFNANNTELSPISHPLGTTIEVRELFFNLPARKHFLRGDKTEQNHITTTLYRLALSQFEVSFSYQSSSNTQFKLPAASTREQQQQRIAKLCGKTFINNSLFIEQQFDDVELCGWIANAQGHRPQTDVNYFFINGRVIRDRVINHAIRQAYDELIPAGRYPAFVLYLTMPLERVDINVHPTKHEVRFRDARLIHGLITRAIHDALMTEQPVLNPASITVEQQPLLDDSVISEVTPHYQAKPSFGRPPVKATLSIDDSKLLFQRFIISQQDTITWLIDLQLAERELRQHQLQQALTTDTLRSRPILVPISVSINTLQQQSVLANQATLNKLGITVSINNDSLLLKSIPSLLSQVDINDFIQAVLTSIANEKMSLTQLSKVIEQQLPLIAISSLEQAKTILQQLPEPNDSFNWCRRLDQQTLSSLF